MSKKDDDPAKPETRSAYEARIRAEHLGAEHRVGDYMRQWDTEHPDDPETIAFRDGVELKGKR